MQPDDPGRPAPSDDEGKQSLFRRSGFGVRRAMAPQLAALERLLEVAIKHFDPPAQAVEPNHLLVRKRVLFQHRIDFVQKIADYNFHIGRSRPSLYPPTKEPRMAEAWPLPYFRDCSSLWGYGRIAATLDAVERFERERSERREHERRTFPEL